MQFSLQPEETQTYRMERTMMLQRVLIPTFEIPLFILLAWFLPETVFLTLSAILVAMCGDPLLVKHVDWFKRHRNHFPETFRESVVTNGILLIVFLAAWLLRVVMMGVV